MTQYRWCLLIPHYNHDAELATYLPRLERAGLPAVVIDDGSDPATRTRLRGLVSGHSWISMIERPRNDGKGAAMIEGMRALARQGYTHAICVDADGQHDPADIAMVLDASREAPEVIYSGKPIFGDDIPTARLHGRKVNDLFARIEAGSRVIEDSMCGFRLYPLGTVLPLCGSIGRRRRMEFDTEILVRAVWAGLPLRFFPTRVVYPPGGRSHFRMVADNIRLTGMHAVLLYGRLVRLLLPSKPLRSGG